MINIYCDESCHLENDGNDIMVLGGITCPTKFKTHVYDDIRSIKIGNGIDTRFEIKWTKVSTGKLNFYIDLIDYFFSNKAIGYRGIVGNQKKSLDHNKYNDGSYDKWYYKMYFRLLDPLIDTNEEYKIFLDIKDTLGGPRVNKLHEVLCNNIYDFNSDVIKSIVQINSKESEIMQLADLMNGLLSYFHRHLYLSDDSSEAKRYLVSYISENYKVDLSKNTLRNEFKFNLFLWNPGRRY